MSIKSRGVVAVVRSFEEIPAKVQRASAVALKRGLAYAVTISQREYLSGPRRGKLDVISTRLIQSITAVVNLAPKGVIGRMGSNVKYAAFHEFGFRGEVSVKGFTRHVVDQNWITEAGGRGFREIRERETRAPNFIDPKTGKERRGKIIQRGAVIGKKRESVKQAQARGVAFSAQAVGAHSRKVNYAGRPFIKPALEKARPIILQTLNEELAKEAQGNGR